MGISIAKHKRALASAAMAVVLVAGLAVPTTVALAEPTAAEKQAEAQQALNKLNEMQQKLDEASNNYYTAIDEQKAAEKKVEEAQEKVDQKTREIEGYQEKLGTRARDMYRSGNTGFLDVILGASSFEQFATTWNTLERLNENDAELVTETKNAREELENAKQEAEEQAEVAANKAAEAKSVKDEAEATTAQMQQTYDSLSAEAQELMRKEEEAAEKARQEAAAREAAAAAAASKNNGGGTVDNSAVQTVTGNTVVDRAMPAWQTLCMGCSWPELLRLLWPGWILHHRQNGQPLVYHLHHGKLEACYQSSAWRFLPKQPPYGCLYWQWPDDSRAANGRRG